VGGVLSDELRGKLLKKPDLTLQKAHDCCRTFEVAELQKYKFSTPAGAGTEHSIGIQPVNKVNEQDKKPSQQCQQLHDPSLRSPCPDVPMSPSSPTIETASTRTNGTAERPAGNAEHSPIVTRSGGQVRKPQRLIESC